MRIGLCCAVVLVASCSIASTLWAQNPKSLTARLNDLATSTALDSVSRPWHLKLIVTVFAKDGASQDGSVEAWRAGEESRTVVSFSGGTVTEYDHAKEHYSAQQGSVVPQIIYDVLDTVLHPGPEPSQLTGTTPELQTHAFGKASLECIMLSRPMKMVPGRLPAQTPLGLFPTFCLQPQTDHLQLTYSFANPAVLRTGLSIFLDHEITTAVSISNGPTKLATGKVVVLSTFVPAEGEFTPPPALKPVGTHTTLLASGVVSALKIGGAPPEYPVSARMAHVSGSVVLHAIIGKDGHMQRLTVMSTPDADLAISALTAVRTWTYKPYLLNGEPTAVETTIPVNYNLSGG